MTYPSHEYIKSIIGELYQCALRRSAEPHEVEIWFNRLTDTFDVVSMMKQLRASAEYLRANNFFFAPGHYYSPIVNIEEICAEFDSSKPIPIELPGIVVSIESCEVIWTLLLPYLQSSPFLECPPKLTLRYKFSNPFFSYGDGSILSAMLRLHAPRQFVEIGSGWSSICTLDTVEHCLGGSCNVTLIEPYPQFVRGLLGEQYTGVDIRDQKVQDVDLSVFTRLEAGDFLFIDSSHVLKTGSDVCFELFEILPRLRRGAFVHFHDIFWPFEYPYDWVFRENRSWNEIYAVRAFLMHNKDYEVYFFNDFFAKMRGELIAKTYPTFLLNSGGSLWLRKL
jgi:hypothetical protein